MILKALYRSLLRLPRFKGKSRIVTRVRDWFFVDHPMRVAHGLRMYLDPQEWLQIELLERGTLCPEMVELQFGLLKPGDCYVNAGAHVGFFTLHARVCVGETGRLLAVDPQPYNCDCILRNAAANGFANITVCVAALGDENGAVKLPHQGHRDKARLEMDAAGFRGNNLPQTFVVPLLRLDRLLHEEGINRVRLLYVNTPSFHLPVLRGLDGFNGIVDHLVVYMNCPENEPVSPPPEFHDWFRVRGYQLRTLHGADWIPGQPIPTRRLWAARPG